MNTAKNTTRNLSRGRQLEPRAKPSQLYLRHSSFTLYNELHNISYACDMLHDNVALPFLIWWAALSRGVVGLKLGEAHIMVTSLCVSKADG